MHSCDHHQICIEEAISKAKAFCEAKNVRFTKQRQRVFELVWESHSPSKAYDILSKLQEEDASAKPPTVYRALDFLLEIGLIHKLHRLNAYIGCSHLDESNPCFFLICRECGEVTEEDDASLASYIGSVADKHHFKPAQTTFEMDGVCQRCIS